MPPPDFSRKPGEATPIGVCGDERSDEMAIRAKAWSDCGQMKVAFDCSRWAEQATDKQLSDLIACGCSRDYAADEVARYMSEHDEEARRLFDFLDVARKQPFSGDTNGFECQVDEGDLQGWLRDNRPGLLNALVAGGFVDHIKAGPELVGRARAIHACDDLDVDEDARAVRADRGWYVQAWVYVADSDGGAE